MGVAVSLTLAERALLAAGVPFYGGQPPAEDVAKIKAPLLIHYAEKDDRINAGIPAFEQALKANKVKYQLSTYPGTQHGFNNDTAPRATTRRRRTWPGSAPSTSSSRICADE